MVTTTAPAATQPTETLDETLNAVLDLIAEAEGRLAEAGQKLLNTPAAKDYPAVKRSIATVVGTYVRIERRVARLQAMTAPS